MARYLFTISWDTEMWCADSPTHLIHFDGERVCELAGLRWRDCQERKEGGQLTLSGKGEQTRTVLVGRATWQALHILRNLAPDDKHVFRVQRGSLTRKGLWDVVIRTFKQTGMQMRFRHIGCATPRPPMLSVAARPCLWCNIRSVMQAWPPRVAILTLGLPTDWRSICPCNPTQAGRFLGVMSECRQSD